MKKILVLLMLFSGAVFAQDDLPPEIPPVPDEEPVLLHFAEAVYPSIALQEGREGTVTRRSSSRNWFSN